jgi:hypothetical protein
MGQNSIVRIATHHRLDGPSGGRDFPHPLISVLGSTQPPVKWKLCLFPWGLSSLDVVFTHPHLAPRLRKGYSYTSTPPLGSQGLLWGELLYIIILYTIVIIVKVIREKEREREQNT